MRRRGGEEEGKHCQRKKGGKEEVARKQAAGLSGKERVVSVFLLLLRWGRRMIEGESEKTGGEQFLFLWRPPSAPPPLSRSHYTHIHQQTRVCFSTSAFPRVLKLYCYSMGIAVLVRSLVLRSAGLTFRKRSSKMYFRLSSPPPPLLACKTPMTTMVRVTL